MFTFLPQQRPSQASFCHDFFFVHFLCNLLRLSSDLYETSFHHKYHGGQRHKDNKGSHCHRHCLTGCSQSKLVQHISLVLYCVSCHQYIAKECLQHLTGLEIYKIIQSQKRQGGDDHNGTLIFQLAADPGHTPSQQTG